MMNASIAVDGGIGFFPGLAKPKAVAFDAIPADVQAQIKDLVSAADFFSRGDVCDGKGADRRTYVIEISDADQVHTLRVTEPVADPRLASLIKLLRKYAR